MGKFSNGLLLFAAYEQRVSKIMRKLDKWNITVPTILKRSLEEVGYCLSFTQLLQINVIYPHIQSK